MIHNQLEMNRQKQEEKPVVKFEDNSCDCDNCDCLDHKDCDCEDCECC